MDLLKKPSLSGLLLACRNLESRADEFARSIDVWNDTDTATRELLAAIRRLSESLIRYQEQQTLRRYRGSKGAMRTPDLVAQAFREAVSRLPEDEVVGQPAPLGAEAEFVFSPTVFSTVEVLQFLGLNKKTGALSIETESERIRVEIRAGDLVDAWSSNSPPGQRLGEILVAQGAISASSLEEFVARHRGSRERLGRALMAEELVSMEQLTEALAAQVRRLFARCLAATTVSLRFHAGEVAPEGRDLRLAICDALLEGLRPAAD